MKWQGLTLRRESRRILATVVPEENWPGLYHVELPDGRRTDMVNLTRAKDAAVAFAVRLDQHRERRPNVE